MEEEKAAALYDELTRKGGGAARFKQGLGFSSSPGDAVPPRGSALPTATSSSSFLSQFVKASEPSTAAPEVDKQAQLSSVQNKLKKKPQKHQTPSSESDIRRSSRRSRSRSRSRDRDRYRYRSSRHRSRSRSRHSRRSRSRSRGRAEHYRGDRRRRRSRSESPRRRNRDNDNMRRSDEVDKGKSSKVDYAKLIEGYDKMTAAERVKAKMKLQLTETAEKDEKNGMGSGWERFDFDKDAPLDDEEIETAEDDAALVKHIGQTFRFSALEAKREQALKDAHDEAMFGAPSISSPTGTGDEEAALNTEEQTRESATASLLSDQVLGMQRVSWRDRVPRSS